ncbi:MAG TPA: alpha/beta fold hydrolase, partial [Humibacillus sp.]|nr:alpha/beta fold hydrolase [Humibacillus sp.]
MWTVTTFVLVPGAGGVAWYWHRVTPLLEQAGHTAIAVDLPGDDPQAGLPEYAALVESAIDGRDQVVLVGQSLGGFTVAAVVARRPVSGIVLLNAMIPVPGETPGQWWDAVGQEDARLAAAHRGGWPSELDLDTYFLHDVDPAVAASGEEHQRPESDAVFSSVCELTVWPDVPVHVVAGADDRFVPLDFQRRVSRDRLGV